MRALLRIGACTSLFVATQTPARAQGIMDRLKKKATEAVEKKAEDKVNAKIDAMSQKLVDNSFSALFGDSTDAANSGGGGAGGGKAGGGMPFSIGSNAKTESSYNFTIVETMEMESTKGRGKSIMKMHFNPNEAYTGTAIESTEGKKSDGNGFIVLDAKNQAMVMLMASDKSKFSIAYDWKEAQKYASASATPTDKVNWDTVKAWRNFTKIGTKTIAGYAAEGYKTDSPDATSEIWVSRDKKLAVGSMFAATSSMKQMKGRIPDDYPQGMMLEMTSTNTKSGEKFTMRVTNIDTNAHVTYSMSDYPKMEMGKK